VGFVRKVLFDEPVYCDVCRKKITEGKLMNKYEKYLPYLCSECFERYFKTTARLEKQSIAVDLRPCDVRKDEYRMHFKTGYSIVHEMIVWLVICTVSLVSLKTVCGTMFRGADATPLPALIILSLLSLISFVLAVDSVRYLITAVMRGADHLRRLLLVLQTAEFVTAGILIMKYMFNWR